MKYFANYKTDNHTTMKVPICDTNKSRIHKDILEIAKGHATKTNCVTFAIWNEQKEPVCTGAICKKKLYYTM